ncbi:hypothetical protein [Archangium sp.]|uniref:hypothetical protein n=1 Tax=Archangium sp. TaxID=1872627 RepID=UPI00286B358F|nr:hypothetical protein [Archangium sp.]
MSGPPLLTEVTWEGWNRPGDESNQGKLAGRDNIRNPVDNILAGVRYAVERYGSVSNVPGIQNLNKGQGYVGY